MNSFLIITSLLAITLQVAKCGEIKKVKVFGCLTMINEGTYDINV